MQRGTVLILVFTGIFLLVFGAFAAWATMAVGKMGTGWSGLLPIWPFVVGGVVVTAMLAGVLMWLAFYSANHGYDDGVDNHDPEPRFGPHDEA
jgi:hypothetical protein